MNKLIFLFFILNFRLAFSDDLIKNKFINIWSYDINGYSGTLMIDNCNGEHCKYEILTISPSGHTCDDHGMITIIDENKAEVYKKEEDCKINFVLLDDKNLKIEKNGEWCFMYSCGVRGVILDDYKKKYKNDEKVYKQDCKNLNFISDIEICTNEKLSRLDIELNNLLLKHYKNYSELELGIFKEEHKEWLKEVRKYENLNNIENLYKQKIKELKNNL